MPSGFRFILNDKMINVSLNIGEVNPQHEEAISVINSDMGTKTLIVYPSSIQYTANVEQWFTAFINAMENLIPSMLGLIIEVLHYIQDYYANGPSKKDIVYIKSILASHEIYFKVKEDQIYQSLDDLLVNNFMVKYEPEVSIMMKIIIDHSRKFPNHSLLTYAHELQYNISGLLKSINCLENEGLIDVMRPGILLA